MDLNNAFRTLKNYFSISDINLKNRTQYIDIESRHSNLDYNRSKAYCPTKATSK